MCFFFFFFKQKTAYEMRISDWSSDVCSSDLPQWEANLSSDLKGKKVGIPKEYRPDGLNAEISAMWDRGIEWLKDAGAEVVDVSLPHTKYALPTYYIIAPAEASSNLARYDGVRYGQRDLPDGAGRSEEHTSELQSLMRTSSAVFCLKKKTRKHRNTQ